MQLGGIVQEITAEEPMSTTLSIHPSAAAPAACSTHTAAPTSAQAPHAATGAVHGAPRRLLRLEGLVLLIAAIAAYRALGGGWPVFVALFLVPDLSMLGYLAGKRVGAATYNAGHTLLSPAMLAAAGLAVGAGANTVWLELACIWAAHIGLDRLLGYGLKYATGFLDTHLGRVGWRAGVRHASA